MRIEQRRVLPADAQVLAHVARRGRSSSRRSGTTCTALPVRSPGSPAAVPSCRRRAAPCCPPRGSPPTRGRSASVSRGHAHVHDVLALPDRRRPRRPTALLRRKARRERSGSHRSDAAVGHAPRARGRPARRARRAAAGGGDGARLGERERRRERETSDRDRGSGSRGACALTYARSAADREELARVATRDGPPPLSCPVRAGHATPFTRCASQPDARDRRRRGRHRRSLAVGVFALRRPVDVARGTAPADAASQRPRPSPTPSPSIAGDEPQRPPHRPGRPRSVARHLRRGRDRWRRRRQASRALTLDPELQRIALGLMAAHHLPEAAVVLMDVATRPPARLREPRRQGAAARPLRRGDRAERERLQDRHGRGAASRTPTSGPTPSSATRAASSASARSISSTIPQRDRWCTTLAGAMGRSINTVFARLASEHLAPPQLEAMARRFGYGRASPFDVPGAAERAARPDRAARVRAHRGGLLEHDAVAARRRPRSAPSSRAAARACGRPWSTSVVSSAGVAALVGARRTARAPRARPARRPTSSRR